MAGKGDRPRHTQDDSWRDNYDRIFSRPHKPVWRCVWCCVDSATSPCEHCDNDACVDRTLPHHAHWSRKTLTTVECKVCDRVIDSKDQTIDQSRCNPQ